MLLAALARSRDGSWAMADAECHVCKISGLAGSRHGVHGVHRRARRPLACQSLP